VNGRTRLQYDVGAPAGASPAAGCVILPTPTSLPTSGGPGSTLTPASMSVRRQYDVRRSARRGWSSDLPDAERFARSPTRFAARSRAASRPT